MQRIIQINIAGQVIPIEDDAYVTLKEYIDALGRQFPGTEGREIIEDIECRVAELFQIRLQAGAPAIDRNDVGKVIETLGAPADLNDEPTAGNYQKQPGYGDKQSTGYTGSKSYTYNAFDHRTAYTQPPRRDRLLRDPYNKMIGGVCSGMAHYFDIDPVIIRLIMAVLFLSLGIGLVAYLIAWAIIPAARTPQELEYGAPVTIHDISGNVGAELEDLKRRGEEMSRELRDFFSKKK